MGITNRIAPNAMTMRCLVTCNFQTLLPLLWCEVSADPQMLPDHLSSGGCVGLSCIIQDSDPQKSHEIGRMEHIYTHSCVTISANSARNCEEGFLQTRNTADLFCKLQFMCEDGTAGRVSIRPREFRATSIEWTDWLPGEQPIDSRA